MASFDIDEAVIRKLADLLNETGLTEIEVEEGDHKLRLAKTPPAQTVIAGGGAPASASQPAPSGASGGGAAPTPSAEPSGPPEGAITSPMVGTAYLSPEPGAPAYVKAGDSVREGQTVMIVEAMKVMNPIKAPRDGTVKEITVADAQPVEYGEVLMVLG
jgi:acetyl-CoA carboxylase biotin carboxyl carrier protein